MNADRPSEPTPIVRIDALTGLRILPALVVLLSHLDAPPKSGPLLKSFLQAGYAGVTVFFVLSGFVLAHNYFERFARQFSLRLLWSYLAARLARVYPLYLLMLVWVTLPSIALGKTRDGLWFDHAFALQAWTGKLKNCYTFNAVGWSISVEFFLYACFPLLVPLLAPLVKTRKSALLGLGLVACGMAALTSYFVWKGYGDLKWEDPQSAHRWLYRNPACRLGDFLLGILTARLVALQNGGPRRIHSLLLGVATFSIVALMCWPRHNYTAPSWDVSYAVPAALLIFALASAPHSASARLLSTPPFVLLGEASYALYLCHVYMLRHLAPGKMPPDTWLLTKTATILMVVAVAVGLHMTIERPGRVLLRWLLDPWSRRSRRRAKAAQPEEPGQPRQLTPAS
ncbi:MAG TPA: acyltransferase [Polyangiaceae bacterium]|nr:acyltransferase [Polyangiaceae bacterium]